MPSWLGGNGKQGAETCRGGPDSSEARPPAQYGFVLVRAIWYAFWGEAKSRPTYLEVCHAEDLEQHEVLRGLCRQVIEEGGYETVDPDLVARGLGAMSDGLWQDLLIQRREFDREAAKRTCYAYLASVFPRHFPAGRATAA